MRTYYVPTYTYVIFILYSYKFAIILFYSDYFGVRLTKWIVNIEVSNKQKIFAYFVGCKTVYQKMRFPNTFVKTKTFL